MDFAHVELALALGEDMDEGFIKSYSIRPDSTSSLASASIVLLEGSSIGLALSDKGYQVTTAMPDATLYATLPDLLKAVSPLYRQAWDGKLFSSLADIAQQECDEDETK